RRVGAHRRRLASPGLPADLPATDGACPGRGRHLRAAARVERIPLPVPAPVLEVEHDGAGGARAVPQQRPVAVELHDGDRDHLRGAAGRDLLRIPPAHDCRPHDGRGQGLTRGRRTPNLPRLRGSELAWAVAFVVPYAAMFAAFVIYPVAY